MGLLRATAKEPRNGPLAGDIYLNMGDVEEALQCFRRALKLNPELEGVRSAVQSLERGRRKRS